MGMLLGSPLADIALKQHEWVLIERLRNPRRALRGALADPFYGALREPPSAPSEVRLRGELSETITRSQNNIPTGASGAPEVPVGGVRG
eukprot:7557487-Alexandrium_andersonii.AAC.2